MFFLSLGIVLVFGFGAAGLAALLTDLHWLWLLPAYAVGSLLGLGAIWLAYILPRRPQPPLGGSSDSASEFPERG